MISIANNGIITMHAGDSFIFPLFIDRSAICSKPKRYKLRAHDVVYFTVCEPNQDFNRALIRKMYTNKNLNKNGDVIVRLDSSDTENIIGGQYYYEIKIKQGNGIIQTIVPRRKFIIIE